MPAQPDYGIWHPFSPTGTHPVTSGVRKVFVRGRAANRYHYYYFSLLDKKWYNANGDDVTREVISYGGLSA